jgi:arsenate reductase
MTTILFVCLHGAAKSVLAATDFERIARERGLAARAVFVGTEPDAEIAPRVLAQLRAEGVDLGGHRPRRVTREDVEGASRIVTFGCDLGDAAAPGARIERWDDVPAVSDDFDRARAAIDAKVACLLDELSR